MPEWLIPGGPCRDGTDDFVQADAVSERAIADVLKRSLSNQVPEWEDPVRDFHTREKSEAVFIFSGKLMQESSVELWRWQATKDYLAPVILYYCCFLSVRARESGGVLHLDTDALGKSGMIEHPAQYAFATSVLTRMPHSMDSGRSSEN